MKTLITMTGEQVRNAVTEFLKKHEISMDNMIFICTDGDSLMIGERKGFVFRLIGDGCVISIHYVLHRKKLLAKILATVIISPFFKRLFHLSTK